MKRPAFALACALTLAPASAFATRAPPEDARQNVEKILGEGRYTFCTSPRPILGRGQALCPLAPDVEHCDALVRACDAEKPRPPSPWLERLLELLGPIAKYLVWMIVAAIAIAVAIPVIRGILRARRDRQLADAKAPRNVAVPLAPPAADPSEITDAEAALRAADAHARAGEHERALALYLAASLAALGHRGAIRLARHKTNGEYVRACAEPTSQKPLREIVREVDRAFYGRIPPTPEAVEDVGARAASLVRAIALSTTILVLAALALGCGALAGGGPNDPAGDDLPMEVLRRQGFAVTRLPSSLATLPIPDEETTPPMVVVDTDKVPLEDEARAHLLRWVEAGGVLVLLGAPSSWPKDLGAKSDEAESRDLVVEETDRIDAAPVHVDGALVAQSRALAWKEAHPVARLGDRVYAAQVERGRGRVLGVAGSDLFTNLGAARPANAAALAGLIELAAAPETTAIQVARAEDGIPPPSNPFAALVQAGLAKGAWHALAACVVLFFAFGIRHARARPTPPPVRRAFAEHVEAVGAFYGRTNAVAHALSAYGRFAEMRLRERLPRGVDPATFLATRASIDPARAAKLLARATSATAEGAPRGDELATIKELRALLAKALA